MKLVVHTDGAARGNPGPSAIGIVVQDETGRVVYEASRCLGVNTNNEAEYLALIAAIEYVKDMRPKDVEFILDSELVVRQVQGQYRVKEPRLQKLHARATMLLNAIPKYSFRHIPRKQNARADELANEALDAQIQPPEGA